MKNLTVVIADDDRLVLKDLRNMVDWEHLGFSIAATAVSGEDALIAIEKYRPFLLITDIQMMGMNGLDVIEAAHDKYPNMKFLVISSYDDFHYVKRAMLSGVLDYLLKTEITPATLTKKLIAAKHSFSQGNAVSMTMAGRDLERFFTDQGETFSSEDYPQLRTSWNNRYYFFVLGTVHLFSRSADSSIDSYRSRMNGMLMYIYNLATEYCAFPLVFCFDCFLVIGLSADMVSAFALHDFSNRLQNPPNGSSESLIQFYSSRKLTLAQFRDYLMPMLPLLHYDLVFYPSRPVEMETIKNRLYIPVSENFSFHSLIFDEDHLETDILLIKPYIETCCGNHDMDALNHFYRSFCTQIEILSNNQLKPPPSLHASTPEFFQKWIYTTLNECIKLLTHGLKYNFSPVVDSAVTFMNQNYSRLDLSSAEIASHVGLSVNRLGIVFKKDTGKTINEYLADIRVDKAISLLEKSDMKIYEIAKKCGYRSSQYFSQVIYQKTGRKPIEYRKGKQ